MIYMLSKFDLKSTTDLHEFRSNYTRFFEHLKTVDLVEATGKIGKRLSDTPMNTDAEGAQKYYVIMKFRDREQLDRSYDYLAGDMIKQSDREAHNQISQSVENPIFTCWQDDE